MHDNEAKKIALLTNYPVIIYSLHGRRWQGHPAIIVIRATQMTINYTCLAINMTVQL